MNPRYPFGVYTISNRARSASYATSPNYVLRRDRLSILLYLACFVKHYFCLFPKNLEEKLLTFVLLTDIIAWLRKIYASVAQSVVHLTRTEKVACSSQVTSSRKTVAPQRFFLLPQIKNPALITKWRPFGDRSGIFFVLGVFHKHIFQGIDGLAVGFLEGMSVNIHGGRCLGVAQSAGYGAHVLFACD